MTKSPGSDKLTSIISTARYGPVCRGGVRGAASCGAALSRFLDLEVQDDATMFVSGSRAPLANEKFEGFVDVLYELKRVPQGATAKADELARCRLRK
jgi:hypothetical protein